ncbi:MAG: type I restriction enzyme HsdR N-terminal domain-containing protein [Chlamydiia bacterium]|nr:type I restriction enzyme HsdR N-terminal domain-containing protein [Chlamydiia bacterium]
MGLSPQNKQIYDPIRKKWVDAFPEEIVRQHLLNHLVKDLGYPPHVMIIEKQLSELPHLQNTKVPSRRIDILCLESETLRPLLLIECKAVSIREKMFAQPLGYNAFIGAPLICLANQEELCLRWETEVSLNKLDRLPTYEQLRRA